MTSQKIEELLCQQENEKLDFKLDYSLDYETNKKEMVKDISAIANTRGGRGYILFGIKDKTKEIVGISSDKLIEEERLQQVISSRIDPPVSVKLEECNYRGKRIIVLTIYKSSQRPHQIMHTGTFYLRRGSTTDIARRSEIAAMLQENGIVAFETVLLPHAILGDLDIKLIRNYISPSLSLKSQKSLLLLESMGIITKDLDREYYQPTMGGMLLFGVEPQKYLISTAIKIEYHGETKLFNGALPTMLDKTAEHIINILSPYGYPAAAVLEALYNAVVHRDYWDTSREIYVYLGKNKIEIVNPGAINAREGIINLEDDLNPSRRNPWLYQRLLLMDKKQRFLNNAVGIRNIYASFSKSNHIVKFINLPKKNLFKVVLPGIDEI
ncbi:MAG: putative DNA binding domain-containing protein [Clostridiales bacterium]|nr:putative DNA binding domain-containing protein [Clostridiales bacterium]